MKLGGLYLALRGRDFAKIALGLREIFVTMLSKFEEFRDRLTVSLHQFAGCRFSEL